MQHTVSHSTAHIISHFRPLLFAVLQCGGRPLPPASAASCPRSRRCTTPGASSGPQCSRQQRPLCSPR
eukprot:scaffold18564_cov69-Phaeocystis_antarctica.AAC.2